MHNAAMALRSLLPEAVEGYVSSLCSESELVKRLRAETGRALPEQAGMQIGPDQTALLPLLVRLAFARNAIEVGTFTGMSALAVASALPPGGKLVCCDVSEEFTSIARRYWAEAGVADRIDLRLAPAAETLRGLLDGGGAGRFDFAFIDADKRGYDAYYELCLQLVRPGGLLALDNMLWSGKVADAAVNDEDTATIRALNAKIAADARVESCLLTVGDGVMLARRR
jgi:caffeoyl-CoA O-methyltransferase